MKIFLNHKFITLNEYINAERMNKYIAAKIKNKETTIAYLFFKKYKNDIQNLKLPLKIKFIWWLKNKKKDLDNVSFSKKFILDGLVKAKCIKNDGQNCINSFSDDILISKFQGVEIEFCENI